jgi:lipoprotein-anchoring transpeptidase ErfK/SrfK
MRRLARILFPTLLCAASGPALAANDAIAILGLQEPQAPASAPAEAAPPAPARGRYGGGFVEMLMTGGAPQEAQETASLATEPATPAEAEPERQFRRQEVDYAGPEAPGTIVIDTPDKFLFRVEPDGRALRFGIGVGRPGFEWAGLKRVSRKAEWPDWTPPAQMLLRRPKLPRHMDGGPVTRSAPEPSTSAPGSTASTAPMSPRRSAATPRRAASG